MFKFISIYRNTLVTSDPIKLVIDQTEIEFFEGTRIYKIPEVIYSVIADGKNSKFAQETTLVLPDEYRYLSITARSKESHPIIARTICEEKLDKIITNLSILFGYGLCGNLVYRGWLNEEQVVIEAWVTKYEAKNLSKKEIFTGLKELSKKQKGDSEINRRYRTMSHFYSKALVLPPCEEKFLFLWTVLEIFPMKGLVDIKPISIYLSSILDKPHNVIKDKLEIGPIYGKRCKFVHEGTFDIPIKEMGLFITKLEEICTAVLRGICGLPYDSSLDKYFK